MSFTFIAIDPGTKKCGIAVMNSIGRILDKDVVPADKLAETISALSIKHAVFDLVVIGDGTGSVDAYNMLESSPRPPGKIFLVPEKNTTLMARKLYHAEHPRSCLMKLVPFGLFSTPKMIDAYAAAAIGRIYLESQQRRKKS